MKASSHNILIAPSILSADPLHFYDELLSIESAGADFHHIDVMDGHFVPNLTFGPGLIRAIKQKSKIPLDVHIMVTNPDEVALSYVEAGADILVFHIEAVRHGHRLAQAIKAAGAKPGVALNPATPTASLLGILPYVDVVTVMSVNPGFGGQTFISEAKDRVAQVSEMIQQLGLHGRVRIEVDGGINANTAAEVVAQGASVLVAGSYIYGSKDRKAAVSSLRTAKK